MAMIKQSLKRHDNNHEQFSAVHVRVQWSLS